MAEAAASRLWESSLGQLQLQLTKANYDTWLRETKGLSFDGHTFVVGVPTDFAKEWLNSRLRGPAVKALSEIIGEEVEVSFVMSNGATSLPEPVEQPARPARRQRTNLLSRQTFDAFIVGDANRFAAAAARAVADTPGELYNPLFLYGVVGQGKTHLLHAIGNMAVGNGANALYVTADKFLSDFVTSIQRTGEEEFRNRYRTLDFLLLDDFQFLVGKGQGKTEEEFLHTFNALQTSQRQIVITCDRGPKLLTDLSDRLRTRLEGGLCIEVLPPGPELRVDFLNRRAADRNLTLPANVVDYLSSHFKLSSRARGRL